MAMPTLKAPDIAYTDDKPAIGDRCLSVRAPWSWLLCRGVKLAENRSRASHYRGPLWIHSSQSVESVQQMSPRDYRWLQSLGCEVYNLALGAIIGRVTLYDCVEYDDLPEELADHPFASGPHCWLVRDAVLLREPVYCSGALGIWRYKA